MDIIYAKESFIKCFLIFKSIVCRKRRWFITYFQPVKILTASYKIIVSWNLSFDGKKSFFGNSSQQFVQCCRVLVPARPMEIMRCARFPVKRFPPLPPKISEGATYEFLLYGKRFDIFYILKRTAIFIKQPLCDNRNFFYVRRRGRREPLGASVYFIPTRRNVYFTRVG